MPDIRVLLVEDDPAISFVVKMALEKEAGFAVTSFVSGVDALEHMRDTARPYDVALVDFRLPGIDGLQFIRNMRAVEGYEALPAIILSAALMDPELQAVGAEELLGTIAKPFRLRGLPQQVKHLLGCRDG